MEKGVIQLESQKSKKGMSSVEVAELIGKQHAHVMRDIRVLLEKGVCESNFGLTSYSDAQGKTRPMYFLSPKGCLILASGYDPVLRERIIDKLEELQKARKAMQSTLPDFSNPAEAARAWALQYEERERLSIENKQQLVQIEAQQEQLQEQKPKVAFADAVLSSPDSVLIGELAKILCQNGYKTGEVRLFEQLRKEGYLCSVGSDRNMPMQRYVEMGLFEVTKGTRSGKNGEQHVTRTTKVTQRGCQYFINKFVSA